MCAKKTKDGSGVIERPDVAKQIADQFTLFLERYRTIETDLRKSIFDEDEDYIAYDLDRLKENDAPWIEEDTERFGGIQKFVNKEYLKTQCFQKQGELLLELIENVKDEFLLNTPSPPSTGDVIRQVSSTIRAILFDFWDIPYCEKQGYKSWGESSDKPLRREKQIEYLILVFRQTSIFKVGGADAPPPRSVQLKIDRFAEAGQQWQCAVDGMGGEPEKVKDAYNWLINTHKYTEEELKNFYTWSRYVRGFREQACVRYEPKKADCEALQGMNHAYDNRSD